MLFALILSLITLQDPVLVQDSSPLPWFRGAEPLTPKNTILVFVHGKSSSEGVWFDNVKHYGHNDMYELAYNAGYRTAFVRLGEESSMWYNGRVLSQQLEHIERYYNTRNIVIIAHSKGGVDAQSALVFYNAIGTPRKIISLSSPYYGSPLADLVFSNLFTFWLSLVIGQATPATFVLQTAYMYRFQNIISNDPDNQHVQYYTLSGWDKGPFPLWLGGAYLALSGCNNDHGGNDGAVCFHSAHVSFNNGNTHRVSLGAYEDSERKWYFNHFNITLGHNTWHYIDSLIQLYPVKNMPALYKETPKYNQDITIRTMGYIKEGDGNAEFYLEPKTKLYILKPSETSISLSKSALHFKSIKSRPIEYGEITTKELEKISIRGKFFIIGNEGRKPLTVKYAPIVKNVLPHIVLSSDDKGDIEYKMFIKQYTQSGKFQKDITLSGRVKSGTYMLLPLYDDALYNVHLRAYIDKSERDIVFTIIKETSTEKEKGIQTSNKLTQVKRFYNSHSENMYYIDILGRRHTHALKNGIFFNTRRNKRKALILIK